MSLLPHRDFMGRRVSQRNVVNFGLKRLQEGLCLVELLLGNLVIDGVADERVLTIHKFKYID